MTGVQTCALPICKTLGSSDGNTLGSLDGDTLGSSDGSTDGSSDGKTLGSSVGSTEGSAGVLVGRLLWVGELLGKNSLLGLFDKVGC